MTPTGWRRRAALALLLTVPMLAGCSANRPVQLTVSVFQYRSDLAVRQAQIEVQNRSAAALTVTSARFASAWFDGIRNSRSVPSRVPAGSTIDFPVLLPPGRCAATAPQAVVTIGYRAADGRSATETLTPKLPFHTISALHVEDCSLNAFEKIATIAAPSELRFEAVGGRMNALLDFTVTPTGSPGTVTVVSSQNTTLLSQPEGELRTIDRSFSSSSPPGVITLNFVPSRCEAHVIAEDKVGTIIPIRVDVGPYRNAVLMIAVPKQVKNQLLEFVARYCGL